MQYEEYGEANRTTAILDRQEPLTVESILPILGTFLTGKPYLPKFH